MPIRITGLNSGLDTESIISALVSSYNYKTQKYQKAQTKLSWKQDAWKSLNTKIYSLYQSVGNLRFSSAYNMKSTTISDSTKVSVSAGSGSVNGSYSVQVTSLAKAGYLTGGKLASGTTSSTKLSDLGYTGGDSTMSLTVDGATTDVSVNGDTTIQQVLNKFKEAGVNASYDETNRRIYVSSKNTGAENDFSLTASSSSGTAALKALGLNVASDANAAEYAELASYDGLDFTAIVQEKFNAKSENAALKTENSNYTKALAYASAAQNLHDVKAKGSEADYKLLTDLAGVADIDKAYVDTDGNVYTYDEETKKYSTVKTLPDGSTDKIEVDEADITDPKYTKATDKYTELAESFGLITNKKDESGADVLDDSGNPVKDSSALNAFVKNMHTVGLYTSLTGTESDNTELQAMITDIDAAITAGTADTLTASYNAKIADNNTKIADNNAILAANEKLTADMTADDIAAFAEKVAYAKGVTEGTIIGDYNKDATRVNGSDAVIYVNGAEYTGDSNTFSINGMTITATGITGAAYDPTETNAVSVTVNTDVQGIYDKVKDFLSQYNAIINEMTSLYNADSAKGYEPLTDEEKDAMSDTEVEKWEEKIKSSILRRDDTLSSLITSMTNAMSQGVKIKGETYYLSNFGIKTLGYLNAPKNEHYAYHIDGDEDDVNTSGNTDKLMAAIAEDPDTVIEFMQGMAKNLYEAVDKKMKSTTLSSIYTVYNDKEMASEYSDYTTTIKKWQERLETKEEYYYNKFSQMETALSKLNSQSSSLSGLFG